MSLTALRPEIAPSYQVEIKKKNITHDGFLKKPLKPKKLSKLFVKRYPGYTFTIKVADKKQIKELGLYSLLMRVESPVSYEDDKIYEVILWIVPTLS